MCGINGFNWSDEKLITKMNRCIKHRGPDADDIFVDNNFSLGHTRLSVIDLSDKGKQPMANKDESIWVTHNGEVYNFPALRKKLEINGYSFKSKTDTEVILHSYEESDTESFKNFNGIFSFCIYDSNKRCVYLVRDRLGIKPLYYYYDNNKFIFSSEIKAFHIFEDVSFSLSDNAILEYFLTMNVSSESFFENIRAVEPGYYLKFELNDNKISKKKYFDIYKVLSEERYLKNKNGIEKELIDELDILLNKVVKDQLIADIPVGTICSGGVDSSLITAIAKKYSNNLKIFNVRVKEKNYDESAYAKKVAEHLELKLIEEELDQKRFKELYTKCISLLDLPLTHPNSVGIYLISKRAKEEGISVLLSGEGADELFGGYPQYRSFYIRSLINKIPLYSNLIKKLRVFISDKEFASCLLEDGNYIIEHYKNLPWVKNRNIANMTFYNTLDFLNGNFEREIISYMLKDLKYFLMPILRRTDRMAMGTGLEMRVPFLDNRVVDFAINIPLKYKVSLFKTKYLLKKVAERYLPKDVVYRKKMGFSLPTADWFDEKDLRKIMYTKWRKINGLN